MPIDPFNRWEPQTSRTLYQSTPCHVTHPPYPVLPGVRVFGGSGPDPKVSGCDVYVSLDSLRVPVASYPWRPKPVIDLVYPIRDMQPPSNPDDFRQMIEWLANQLGDGAKVHIGCHAGHGRTGMVLAALRMFMAADADAIMHVRTNYCSRAVESEMQVDFLVKEWGCNFAPASKPFYPEPKAKTPNAGPAPNRTSNKPSSTISKVGKLFPDADN